MSCRIGSGSQIDILIAQEKFSLELTRLIAEKKTAYLAAQSLTGSAQVNALQVANLKFRTGYQIALKTMKSIKHEKRWDRLGCKIEKKIDKHDENKDDDDNNHDKKYEMKNSKKLFKEMKKMSKGNDR